MNLLNKAKFTIFFNSIYALGIIMFKLILTIVVIAIVYYTFNGGLNIKVNNKTYQFQVDAKGVNK